LSSYTEVMSDSDADDQEPSNPFAGIPMFADMARLLQNQGPINWDLAQQFAYASATGGATEANIDPIARVAIEQLGRIADLHVGQVTGLDTTVAGRDTQIVPVTRSQWANRTLDAYRPLVTQLATSLGQSPGGSDPAAGLAGLARQLGGNADETPDYDDDENDPMMAMMAGLSQMMAPSMLGMAVGSMVGHLAARAFGQYDLPIPRPKSHELLVVTANIDAFAGDWSLPPDELRLWVCLQELTAHAVLNVAHVRAELEGLVSRHVAGFRPDPRALADKLGDFNLGDQDAMRALQRSLGDPEVLLGAVQTPDQVAALPRLNAIVSVITGYVDHAVDLAAAQTLGSGGRIAEAVRRRRIEASAEDVFVEKLFGLTLTRQQVERGKAFADGVVERAGEDGLARLFASPDNLPTPNEVDAPGLWLARIDL
jgi:putative hydrolase